MNRQLKNKEWSTASRMNYIKQVETSSNLRAMINRPGEIKSSNDFSSLLAQFRSSHWISHPRLFMVLRCFSQPRVADVIDRYRVKRQCSWLRKQGWFRVVKYAGILRFYRRHPRVSSKMADEANARASFPWYPGNWRVLPTPSPRSATGLFNFVHKSLMEE